MKLLFENWRKFILNENEDEELKDKIIQKLKDEGGAAGIEPLLDVAKEVNDEMTEEDLEKFLDDLENVGRHELKDYILDDTEQGGVIKVDKEEYAGVELDDEDEEDQEKDEDDEENELKAQIKEALLEMLDEKRKKSRRKTKKKRSRKKSSKKKGKADDRCTRIAKRKYDVWPSAYASGAVVKCRQGKIWKGVSENTDLTLNEEYENSIVDEISDIFIEVMTEKKSPIQKKEQVKNQKDPVEGSIRTKIQKTQ